MGRVSVVRLLLAFLPVLVVTLGGSTACAILMCIFEDALNGVRSQRFIALAGTTTAHTTRSFVWRFLRGVCFTACDNTAVVSWPPPSRLFFSRCTFACSSDVCRHKYCLETELHWALAARARAEARGEEVRKS